MSVSDCHPAVSARDKAKALIMRDLGIRRVASWCDVGESAVYHWFSRGTDEEPIPPSRVLSVIQGARAEGFEAPLEVLWPAAVGTLEVRL